MPATTAAPIRRIGQIATATGHGATPPPQKSGKQPASNRVKLAKAGHIDADT
jgi:hypothetical protein